MVKLGFKKLAEGACIPKYAHPGDAGMDVYALEDTELSLGTCKLVRTGIAAEIPDGYELQVRARSGLALKGVTVWNAPGTIDSKYRGEIGVPLMYLDLGNLAIVDSLLGLRAELPPYRIKKGDRIAQLVLAPVSVAVPYEVQELSSTERGTGGFGSTRR